MTQANPFTPPQSHVADLTDSFETDIDSLPVSAPWKKRFNWLKKAGGPSMPNFKTMPKAERKGFNQFNILAFLFGPFYYLAKGMWRKGISLFVVCAAVVIALELLLVIIGFEQIGKALGYGVSAVFAMRANIDYYKKMVLGENGWW
jgi:Protein of unknown function (DUF2628)